ncbi:MAG: DUF2971 domain-containing protein [Acetobacter sp.]|jgi:hypothetical protein|nr:DUF2971 domain-containing protein [Acetobacter sp.]MCH4061693.1 DUF2971 domain-containing protein [Acetobacter sp.]MCH4089458.1 DUF2971 domain-containing protein [Acetobacter sp.]MCI1293830.1 DUF2971 domain-containing protein [Acetobacter sp.]MCI1320414.1 DUF2971 domain-containing protein [Acetobacter sp.]
MEPPETLYKFRKFNDLTIKSVIEDTIFFALPETFNDPLDCKPVVEATSPDCALYSIYRRLVSQRISREITPKYAPSVPRGESFIAGFGRLHDDVHRLTDGVMADTLGSAGLVKSVGNDDGRETRTAILVEGIQDELRKREQRGVFCLSASDTNVLMWSHYGDNHQGLCLGYSVPKKISDSNEYKVSKVDYAGSRIAKTRDLDAMLAGDVNSRDAIDEAAYLAKAGAWSYENEWRILGPAGNQKGVLNLEEIIFGFRCSEHVQTAIRSIIATLGKPIKFSKMVFAGDGFDLQKEPLDGVTPITPQSKPSSAP